MKQLVTRFVTESKEALDKQGYASDDSELGKIYYHPDMVRLGRKPEVRMKSFLKFPYIKFKDIYVRN